MITREFLIKPYREQHKSHIWMCYSKNIPTINDIEGVKVIEYSAYEKQKELVKYLEGFIAFCDTCKNPQDDCICGSCF